MVNEDFISLLAKDSILYDFWEFTFGLQIL